MQPSCALHGTAAWGLRCRRWSAARCFEPLVTTRPEGTGLGLAICPQIIERQGWPKKLGGESGDENVVGDEISPPESARFLKQAEQPLQATALHPGGGHFFRAGVEIKGGPHPHLHRPRTTRRKPPRWVESQNLGRNASARSLGAASTPNTGD